MRIYAIPKAGISYNCSLYGAIEALNVTVEDCCFGGGWLLRNIRKGDWVHLHWPSFAYSSNRALLFQLLWFVRFAVLIVLIRLLGGRLAWTAHNLLPHDRHRIPVLDVVARHLVIRLSRLVFAHGKEAAASLTVRFPSALPKVVIIPHGNWIGYYANVCDRSHARERLGIPKDAYLYLFLGLCKPYKNLEGLLRAFRSVTGHARLLVAGRFQDPAYQAEILSIASEDSRVTIQPGFVEDDDIQLYLNACDIVVVPYREILTSGTAMLAMSFGKPVLSVDLGYLRDVVTPETGVLYSPSDRDGLRGALFECRAQRFDEAAIRAHAQQFSFAEAARITVAAMRAVEEPHR